MDEAMAASSRLSTRRYGPDHFGGAGQVERQPAAMRDAAARPERRTQAGLQLMNAMVPCSNSCAMMQSLEKPSPSR